MEATIYGYTEWIDQYNPDILKDMYFELLHECGFTILNFIEHHFKPCGYTAIWLLAESHFAIHTFPEEKKTYIELSSCTRKFYNTFIKGRKGTVTTTAPFTMKGDLHE